MHTCTVLYTRLVSATLTLPAASHHTVPASSSSRSARTAAAGGSSLPWAWAPFRAAASDDSARPSRIRSADCAHSPATPSSTESDVSVDLADFTSAGGWETRSRSRGARRQRKCENHDTSQLFRILGPCLTRFLQLDPWGWPVVAGAGTAGAGGSPEILPEKNPNP